MQRKILLAMILTMHGGNLLAMDNWFLNVKYYLCSLLHINMPQKRLPLVYALYEFGDKDGKPYPDDYLNRLGGHYSTPAYVWTHCSKVNLLHNHGWPISSNDYMLLRFAKKMAHYEAQSKQWYEAEMKVPPVDVGVDKNGKVVKVYQAFNSPYYKDARPFSRKIAATYNRRQDLEALNALENGAYHDELMFLQTQLEKIKLDWHINGNSKDNLARSSYIQTYQRLKNEIEWFTTENSRKTFTHSCMQKKDFEDINIIREAAEK
jgi:hypothetical protein